MQNNIMNVNLGSPPRHVPISVRTRIMFGSFLNQFGWVFFGFGMIFVWIFTCNSDLTGWYKFAGDLDNAKGEITASRETSFSEGGSEHTDGTPVFEHKYTFTSKNGQTHQGISYITGGGLKDGQSVTVEFPQANPAVSRIKGMRRNYMGLFGIFPVLFPGIGLCFILVSFRKGLKGNRLLRDGKLSQGTLVSKDTTNTRINKQMVYKLTFEFNADDGQTYQATAKTHQTHILEDQAEEPLLYDQYKPSYAVLLDDLPGHPRIDEMGEIQGGSFFKMIGCTIIPLITIIGHGTYIYTAFLR